MEEAAVGRGLNGRGWEIERVGVVVVVVVVDERGCRLFSDEARVGCKW